MGSCLEILKRQTERKEGSNQKTIVLYQPSMQTINTNTDQNQIKVQRGIEEFQILYSLSSEFLAKCEIGSIRKCQHKFSNKIRAVRIVPKTQDQEQNNQTVYAICTASSLDHPNIMKVIEYFECEEYFYIVMEYCSGGEMFVGVKDLILQSERDIARAFQQLLSALCYLHARHIAHKKIQSDKILFETSELGTQIKLNCLELYQGVSPHNEPVKAYKSIFYLPPEMIKQKSSGRKADVWMCGVILYYILSGVMPFQGKNNEQITKSILKGVPSFEGNEWENVSTSAKTLIADLLEYDPVKRISIHRALKSKWFSQLRHRDKVKLSTPSSRIKQSRTLSKSALLNMRSFEHQHQLQEGIMKFLIENLQSQAESSRLRSTFQLLDTNKDGLLSEKELIQGYLKTLSKVEAELEVQQIMIKLDTNKNGFIDYNGNEIKKNLQQEFIIAASNKAELIQDDILIQTFNMIDQDQNGYVTKKELKCIFNNRGQTSDLVLNQLLQYGDQDHDGRLSFQEFRVMMSSIKI